MNDEQKRVLAGMLTADVGSSCFVIIGFYYVPMPVAQIQTMGDRIAFALQWDCLAVFMLLVGVGSVARQRFFLSSAIDGSAPRSGTSLDINIRYIQNTAEQCLLLVIGHLALATVVSEASLKIIPVLVALFIAARTLFWVGYHRSPLSRAVGFAATFYPTIAVYIYCMYKVLGAWTVDGF